MGSGNDEDGGGFNFKNWYSEHGETLNESRRDRYNTDDAYRERVLKMNRDSRERRRKEREEQRRTERESVKTKTRPIPFKTVGAWVATEDGKEEESAQLFTIGVLAHTLGCSVQAIRIW